MEFFGQRSFNVRVVRYDLAQHIMVAETLQGHPVKGWRGWQVSATTNGDILVETWTVDEPASRSDLVKFWLGGEEGQRLTWVGLLRNLAGTVGGVIDGGENDGITLDTPQDSQTYFDRFGISM